VAYTEDHLAAGEENSNDDMGVFLNTVEGIARAVGAALSFVHHTGHQGEHGRGASAQLGALDWSYSVGRADGGPITLTCKKSKDSEEGRPKMFRLHKVELPIVDDDGEHETSAVIQMDDVQETPAEQADGANQFAFKEALRDLTRKAEQIGGPAILLEEVRKASKLPAKRWPEVLKSLLDRGDIEVDGQFIRLVEGKT
jgi:hypothetical protein